MKLKRNKTVTKEKQGLYLELAQKVKYPKVFCQHDAIAGWFKCESICVREHC